MNSYSVYFEGAERDMLRILVEAESGDSAIKKAKKRAANMKNEWRCLSCHQKLVRKKLESPDFSEVAKSLRLSVKPSLDKLRKAICGDKTMDEGKGV